MNFKNYKYELIFGSGLIALFAALFMNILNWSPKKAGLLSNVSFEMVRPKSDYRNEYSLKDRAIDREFVNPFKKREQNAKNEKPQKPKMVPITKVADSKKSKSTKMEQKKSGLSVNVVPRSPSRPIVSSIDSDFNSGYDLSNRQQTQEHAKTQNNIPKQDEEKKKSDFSDLVSNPTQEKLKEFILAYKQGNITSDEFYAVVEKMLISPNPNAQSMAVYACYTFPSVTSFSVVAENSDSLNAEVKSYANDFLLSYNHQARLQYLGQALQSKNLKVVMKAGEVIISGLQKVKSGSIISYTGRESRGNNNITSTKSFDFLVPIAETLKKSTDQSVVALGQTLSEELN